MSSKLGGMLGQGSFGKVYLLGNDKVVKYIHLYQDGLNDYIEPYILSNLDHRNIMKSEFISLGEGQLKILMEKGSPISTIPDQYVKKDKMGLFNQVKDGLIFLHSRGIVHGDIKPSNIIKIGDIYKINDFGLSMLLRTDPQDIDIPVYSENYRPPEVKGWLISRKSDIWAFGKLLENYFTYKDMLKKGYKNFLKERLEDRPLFSKTSCFITDTQIVQNNLSKDQIDKKWGKIMCYKLRNNRKKSHSLPKDYLSFEKSLLNTGIMSIDLTFCDPSYKIEKIDDLKKKKILKRKNVVDYEKNG